MQNKKIDKVYLELSIEDAAQLLDIVVSHREIIEDDLMSAVPEKDSNEALNQTTKLQLAIEEAVLDQKLTYNSEQIQEAQVYYLDEVTSMADYMLELSELKATRDSLFDEQPDLHDRMSKEDKENGN